MLSKSLLDCERERLIKMEKMQLPNHFKKFGVAITIIAFFSIIVNKFTFNLPEWRIVAKYGMLIGVLLISVSKDKIEDELITKLRMQSYTFAFITGVIFAMVQPFINYLVDYFTGSSEVIFKDTGDFEILWILLTIQVLYFEVLKQTHR